MEPGKPQRLHQGWNIVNPKEEASEKEEVLREQRRAKDEEALEKEEVLGEEGGGRGGRGRGAGEGRSTRGGRRREGR